MYNYIDSRSCCGSGEPPPPSLPHISRPLVTNHFGIWYVMFEVYLMPPIIFVGSPQLVKCTVGFSHPPLVAPHTSLTSPPVLLWILVLLNHALFVLNPTFYVTMFINDRNNIVYGGTFGRGSQGLRWKLAIVKSMFSCDLLGLRLPVMYILDQNNVYHK